MLPGRIGGLLYCGTCSFVTADLKVPEKELQRIYGRHYFNGGEYPDYAADERIIKKNFKTRLATLLKFVDDPGKKSLFEIGCAYGFFLESAAGYFRSAAGIDISKDAVVFARKRGVSAFCGNFTGLKKIKKADVFCMWDTIEHLPDPAETVGKISRMTNKGGLIALTTGDIHSLNAIARGKKWRQIRPPVHLHYFSRKSLTTLLEKNGFEVIYTGHPGQYANLGSMLKIMLVVRNKMKPVYAFFEAVGLAKLNIYLNLFDLIYMIARKK